MEASVMTNKDSCITQLCQKIKERAPRGPLTFPEFTDLLGKSPRLVFRNIFQMFYDMMHNYVGEGINEYPDDPESIDFVYYDTSRLFEEGTDHPFFADRLFANRLISHVKTFRRGIRQNRIYILEGPHGCGKSTFLNNLLMKFEQYSRTEEGAAYEIVWRLNRKDLGWGWRSGRKPHHVPAPGPGGEIQRGRTPRGRGKHLSTGGQGVSRCPMPQPR